jgi:hypothetical protein
MYKRSHIVRFEDIKYRYQCKKKKKKITVAAIVCISKSHVETMMAHAAESGSGLSGLFGLFKGSN